MEKETLNFKEYLKYYMKYNNIKEKELAKELGCQNQRIKKYLKDTNPKYYTKREILDKLNCPFIIKDEDGFIYYGKTSEERYTIPKRSKWFGLWNNQIGHYMISQPIQIDSIKEFTESDNFRLIIKKNKYYSKDSNKPYYCFAIGNCYESANNSITSYDMQYILEEANLLELDEDELVEKINEITGIRLYTQDEVRKVKYGAAEDGKRGYDGSDILIEDYI